MHAGISRTQAHAGTIAHSHECVSARARLRKQAYNKNQGGACVGVRESLLILIGLEMEIKEKFRSSFYTFWLFLLLHLEFLFSFCARAFKGEWSQLARTNGRL